jgi:hypothetical protein
MVLPASEATSLTTTAVAEHSGTDLQTEVSLAEAQIRSAASFGLYSTAYNATTIGNPKVLQPDALSSVQLAFYNAFIDAGFRISLDPETGYWLISWETQGAESQVAIYSFRTSIDPTAVVDLTTQVIQDFFLGLRPPVLVSIAYNGFLDEADFGATSSLYYEFTVVANQGSDNTNNADALRNALIIQGLGYTIDNCRVYRIV